MIEVAHQTVFLSLTNCVCLRGENDWDGPSNCFFESYKMFVCEGGE